MLAVVTSLLLALYLPTRRRPSLIPWCADEPVTAAPALAEEVTDSLLS
jgi:hypothetical protein